MIALSVMWMSSGQTSVQHFVMLQSPMPSSSFSSFVRETPSIGCISSPATRTKNRGPPNCSYLSWSRKTWHTFWPPSLFPRNTLRIASAIKPPLFVLGQNLLQLCRHLRKRVLPQSHRSSVAPDNAVLLPPLRAQLRKINPAMRPAALFPHQRAARHSLRHRKHGFQLDGHVPPRIEHPRAFHTSMCCSLVQFGQLN